MNKRNFFLLYLVFLIVLQNPASAQEKIPLRKETFYPGYIVLLSRDTLKGQIFFRSFRHLQHAVDFYKDPIESAHTEQLTPEYIIGFHIAGYDYVSLPFSGEYSMKKESFMQQIISGPVSVYKWYYDEKQRYFEDNDVWSERAGSTGIHGDQTQLFLVKTDGEVADLNASKYKVRFKKNMSTFLGDCQEIASRIKENSPGYTYRDIMEIVREYNEWFHNK